MKVIDKDLEEYKIPKLEAETLAQDGTAWRNLISWGMSSHVDVTVSDDGEDVVLGEPWFCCGTVGHGFGLIYAYITVCRLVIIF